MITLDYRQKKILFEKGFITARALGTTSFAGWESAWINGYSWRLDRRINRWGKISLFLCDRVTGVRKYEVYISPSALQAI